MISGEWKMYHRKEFVKTIGRRCSLWSDSVIIEYPVSLILNLLHKFKSRFLPFLAGNNKYSKIENNLSIFTPFILFHYKVWSKFKFAAFIDSLLLRFQFNRLKKKYFIDSKIILWVYIPHYYNVLRFIKYDYLIYDMYDDNEYDYDGSLNINLSSLNKKLVLKANLTFVVAQSVYDRIHKYTDKVELITNGINKEFYSTSQSSDNNELNELIGKKIIGYLGTVRNWIDFDLIESILIKFPESIVMFVGYVDRNGAEDFERLKKYKNLLHVNFIPHEETPAYLASFDVGLIPFKVNSFTVSVFPYKFYEYIAASIPIVTTALPELKKYKDHILYSETNEIFVENIEKVLNSDFQLGNANYSTIAFENSWENKVDILEKRINKFLT